LYARVSGDDRGKDGRNLAGQLEMCREYAQEHGWQVVVELAEDMRGVSGKVMYPPELERALDMAEAKQFDVLVVRELDRFARRVAKQYVVEEQFRRAGINVEYVLESYDDTPEGQLQKGVKAALAEFETLKTAQRTRRARRRKVQAGHVLAHGKPPYGYRLQEVDGKRTLVPHEPEARFVRLVFEWYLSDGLSTNAIAKRLTEMGIPTWADVHNPSMRSNGNRCQWYASTVRKLLTNETYAGTWRYGRRNNHQAKNNPQETWLTVEVEPLIDRNAWKTAQRQLKRRNNRGKRDLSHAYLLRRRVRCGRCGHSMRGRTVKSCGKLYSYYSCNSGPGRTANGRCGLPSFRVDKVDAVVWDWVKSFLTDPQTLAEGLRARQAEDREANKPLRRRLAVVDSLLADNEAQLQRALDLYLSGEFPKEMLVERKERLQQTVESLEQERTALVAQLEDSITDDQIESITEFAGRINEGLGEAEKSFEAKRTVIDTLDIWSTLAVEDGQQVVYVQCVLGDRSLLISDITSRS